MVRILVCVGAALNAGLGFRVAIQSALHKLDLALDFGEFGIFLTIVNRGRQDQTCDRQPPNNDVCCCRALPSSREMIVCLIIVLREGNVVVVIVQPGFRVRGELFACEEDGGCGG